MISCTSNIKDCTEISQIIKKLHVIHLKQNKRAYKISDKDVKLPTGLRIKKFAEQSIYIGKVMVELEKWTTLNSGFFSQYKKKTLMILVKWLIQNVKVFVILTSPLILSM